MTVATAAGPIILTGVALGISSVHQSDQKHVNDRHKVLGIIIFGAYILQCLLGAFIHWIKDPNRTRRPPQNYAHAIFGLLIIAVSMYQVHLGYSVEWESATGRDDPPHTVNAVWIALVIVRGITIFD